jgi:beta-N-acetylhexosaminidase
MANIFKLKTWLFILLIALVALFFLYNKSPVAEKQLPVLESDQDLKNKIGQMLLIGFRGIDVKENSEIFNIIKDVKVGGVVLFDYDIPSNSFPRNIVDYNQTKKLVEDLQKYSETSLFIAVDAEGGKVNRLKPEYGFYNIVSAKEMADKNMTDEQSKKVAEQLSKLGFNMNLVPVVDININTKNPIIGGLGRSFSVNEQIVTDSAEIFIKNHIEKNIITVEKHFPGHGSSKSDSHLGLVDVTNVYDEKEFLPYKKLNDKKLLDAVMTAHIINKNIDKNYPASLSFNFLQNILRDQIGFNGVIISDDMQMGAISKEFSFEQSIILAINAGSDVISLMNNSLENYDSQMAYKARDVIFWAVKEGKISREKIEESYNRIIELKRKYGVLN